MSEEQKEDMIRSYEKSVIEPQKKIAESYAKINGINPNIELDTSNVNSEPVKYDVFNEIKESKSPLKEIEDNNWKRHNEQVDVQQNILTALEGILNEQKSTSNWTKLIVALTFFLIAITIIIDYSKIISFLNFVQNFLFTFKI